MHALEHERLAALLHNGVNHVGQRSSRSLTEVLFQCSTNKIIIQVTLKQGNCSTIPQRAQLLVGAPNGPSDS